MLGLGLGLKLEDFTRVLKTPKDFIVGFVSQLIILPLVAYLLIMILKTPPEIAIGVMIIAAAPGGVTSNILNLTSPPFAMDNSLFRAVITKDEYVCATFSTSVTLDLSDPGITPSGMPLVLNEGVSNDTFTIVLSDTPSDTVQINFTVSPTGHYVVSQDFVVFNNSNWNTPQSINLDAIDEPLVDGTVTATLVLDFDPSSDDCFIPLGTSTYSVTIFNNDIPGWDVSEVIKTVEEVPDLVEVEEVGPPSDSESTTISTGKRGIVDSAFVTENDLATAEFSIVLTAQPVNDVFVDIINNDSTEKTLSDTSLTFTNSNWNVSQTIIINSVDDFLIDGDQNTSITARIMPLLIPHFYHYLQKTDKF